MQVGKDIVTPVKRKGGNIFPTKRHDVERVTVIFKYFSFWRRHVEVDSAKCPCRLEIYQTVVTKRLPSESVFSPDVNEEKDIVNASRLNFLKNSRATNGVRAKSADLSYGPFCLKKKKNSSQYGPYLLPTFQMFTDVRMLNTLFGSRKGGTLFPEGLLQYLLHLDQS